MEGVEIQAFNLIGENEKGSTFSVNAVEKARGGLAIYRKKDVVFGGHYHRGTSPGKKPETMLLLSGKMNMRCENIHTEEKGEWQVEAPCTIKIGPEIWHEVKALSQVIIVELNSLEEHSTDTYYDYQPHHG